MATASLYWDDPDSWRTLLPPDDPLYRPPAHEEQGPVVASVIVQAAATGSVSRETTPSAILIASATGMSLPTSASSVVHPPASSV